MSFKNPVKRKFDGKYFSLMGIHTRKHADSLSKDFRNVGYYVRITKVKDGYALWTRAKK